MAYDNPLLNEREKTYGDWISNANMTDALIQTVAGTKNWAALPPFRRQAVAMILLKVSRIITGDAGHADNWDDIAGYAVLGKGRNEEFRELPRQERAAVEKDDHLCQSCRSGGGPRWGDQ